MWKEVVISKFEVLKKTTTNLRVVGFLAEIQTNNHQNTSQK
jgi:hypothetical protein